MLKCNALDTENQKLAEKVEACRRKLARNSTEGKTNAAFVEKYGTQIRELGESNAVIEQKIADIMEDI